MRKSRARTLAASCIAFAAFACSPATDVAQGNSNPLDPYPGFGVSDGAVLRDEAILMWESYRRHVLVSYCMESRYGFSYWPEMYQGPNFEELAGHLGVTPKAASGLSHEQRNAAYIETLDQRRQYRYHLALWGGPGEPLHGSPPPPASWEAGFSREERALGGCLGRAEKIVPGVGDLENQLGNEWDMEFRRALSNDPGVRDYRRCIFGKAGVRLDHPGAVEDFLLSDRYDDEAKNKVEAASTGCSEVWARVRASGIERAEHRFAARHRELLESWRRSYAGILDRIRSDKPFIEHFRQELANEP
ncbi:MAG: hypothetical protein ACRDKJ_07860 [Actinomycetota bacterium]